MSRLRTTALVLAALALVGSACSDDVTSNSSAIAEAGPVAISPKSADATPVIVDYSPTVSDVGGLMYLLAHPDVDVIAVSLPVTGEAGCDLGVEVTLGILTMFGREDVPVACDPERPAQARDWPEEFLAGSENLLSGLPNPAASPSDLSGPDLIAEAAASVDRPVVLYAVAPLTNVARALDRHPELAGNLERIVIMGGAVNAPGNVGDTAAEWNFWIDVPAAADVIASSVPITLVPLDATNGMPVSDFYEEMLGAATQSRPIMYLSNLVGLFPAVTSGFFYHWDELAAAVTAGEDLVAHEDMTIVVIEGGADDGRTEAHEAGFPATIAVGTPDPKAYYDTFLSTLAGAPFEGVRPATGEEDAYLRGVEAATEPLERAFQSAFDDPVLAAAFFEEGGEFEGPAVAESLDRLISEIVRTYEAVLALDPPESLREVHGNFVDVFGVFAENKEANLNAAAQAATVVEFFAAAPQFPDVNEACRPMAEQALVLGVDVVIVCNPRS